MILIREVKEVSMEQTVKRFRKRDAILTCLRQTVVHPSADWVFAQLKPEIPDLSLGTNTPPQKLAIAAYIRYL